MEYKEVMYYIVDRNNRFVSCDYEANMLYSSDYIKGESYSTTHKDRAKDMSLNLVEEFYDGEYGKVNVVFPLRVVKVTSSHIVEEIE